MTCPYDGGPTGADCLSQVVSKHYQRVLTQWPVDALRPDVSFQKAMRMRIDRRLETANTKSENHVVANGAQATIPMTPRFDEQAELAQVNVLYSFLENRYSQKVYVAV